MTSDDGIVTAFISSTQSDLSKHRTQVSAVLRRLGVMDVAMEYFGAQPAPPLDVCLSGVAKADVFIGIYAHRYGSVPEGESQSYTELELNEAKRLKKPRFCFIVKPDHPWPLQEVEAGESKELLQSMLERVTTDHTVEWFSTPDDLAVKVLTAISSYLLGSSGRNSKKTWPKLTTPRENSSAAKKEELLIRSKDAQEFRATMWDYGQEIYRGFQRHLSVDIRLDALTLITAFDAAFVDLRRRAEAKSIDGRHGRLWTAAYILYWINTLKPVQYGTEEPDITEPSHMYKNGLFALWFAAALLEADPAVIEERGEDEVYEFLYLLLWDPPRVRPIKLWLSLFFG